MSSSTSDPTGELAAREQALTDEVMESFADARDARTRLLLQALVRHVHAFAREVRLTEREWQEGISFLTRAGEITDARRQEFILLSDVLGLSMQTVAINAPRDTRATEATVFGPFFVEDAPEVPFGGDIAQGVVGEPCWVQGRVETVDGEPVPNARIEVWEADEDGFYDVQYRDDRTAGRACTHTDDQGRYAFWSVRPAAYPIPDDGPVGDLMKAGSRSVMRPAHIHFMVTAPGCARLVTHVFTGGPHLEDDAVFGVKKSLIRQLAEQPPGEGPGGRVLADRWWKLDFDIVLARADEQVPA